MDISPVNPINYQGGTRRLSMAPTSRDKEVSQEFLTLFLSSVLKDALRVQNDGLLGSGHTLENLNDLFVQEVVSQLTQDDQFGLNELVYENVVKKPSITQK